MADSVALIPFYRKRLFWLVCGIPTLVSSFYLFIWATPRYKSEAILHVYEAGQDSSSAGGGEMASMGGGSSASPGAYVFKSFVTSWNAFNSLDPRYMKKNWSQGDVWTRFGGVPTFFSYNPMWLWSYYRSHVIVTIDDTSGLINLSVEGYDAQFSHDLAERVIELGRLELAQSGIKADRAEREMLLRRLNADRNQLAIDLESIQELQKHVGISDLKSEYASLNMNLSNFQKERFTVNTKAAAAAYLAQRNQQMATLRAQLAAIDSEISSQRKEVRSKSKIYEAFSKLQQAVSEDSQVIMLDQTSLLESEQNSVRHAYYMDCVESPVLPTDPTLPKALVWSFFVLVLSFVVYFIVK
ncbi:MULTISPECIES: hypothetical protein [unclassified Saccharibacter]|uniref:hypothetical protein n=1 Tax=unclassified Saccharibacter TaxID=2648722 RepID=UPI0013543AC3|nr:MULTISPECIES: hypothetical protein [unclassified Saccharibacter]MXV58513.1 hypothetical protein [Saccharibacter sp. EH70]MXV66019.1 hypothetical protein [Saccharibacter sp. EH60]